MLLGLMYPKLFSTPFRVASFVAGAVAGTLAYRQAKHQLCPQIEQSHSFVSDLERASQETTGKIWFGEEESSSK